MTHAYAHAHFSNKRVIRELRIVSCPGGGVWVAVTREFERDNCVISEILQSDWTIPNRAGVPRKSTKVPRPSFRVWAGRSGHETRFRHALGTGERVIFKCGSAYARMRVNSATNRVVCYGGSLGPSTTTSQYFYLPLPLTTSIMLPLPP